MNQAVADDDDDEIREDGKIELSAMQIEYAGIKFDQVDEAKIRDSLPVYGVVVTNANNEQEVRARFKGNIRQINKKVGDLVIRGETLLTIEANESLKTYPIKSELAGIVTYRDANIGEQVSDQLLLKIENFSTVWVDLAIFPKDVSKVHLNQHVLIKNADGSLRANGQIIYIAPFSDPVNQSRKARVLMENSNRQWSPGLFATGEITLSQSVAQLVVKNESIQIIDGNPVVFVKEGDLFEPRILKLGRRDSELTEVISGLEALETYVSKNSFVLKSELGKGDIEDDD